MGTLVDRLEELLLRVAAEDEDEGQEDVPALARAAVPAAPTQAEGEPAGTDEQIAAEMGEKLEVLGQAAGAGLAENGRARGEAPDTEPLWPVGDGPVWAAETAARRQAAAEALGQVEGLLHTVGAETGETVAGRGAGYGGELVFAPVAPGTAGAVAGLERLYRQTAQVSRPAAPALPAQPAGRTVRVEEPGGAASRAVDELDRAVRRDSRRYDGGMSIF